MIRLELRGLRTEAGPDTARANACLTQRPTYHDGGCNAQQRAAEGGPNPMTTLRKVNALAALLALDTRGVLPRDLPIELADRLFLLAVHGADVAQLQALSPGTPIRDGYRHDGRLGEYDFDALLDLVRRGRHHIADIDRRIAALTHERGKVAALFNDTDHNVHKPKGKPR
jgi:hypothetical protein